MAPSPGQRLGRHRIARARDRFTRLPDRTDLARFVGELRQPSRVSAARAVVDGYVVTATLKRRGARPLLRATRPGAGMADAPRSMEVSRAVDAGMQLLPLESTCLRRSLTLLRELNRLHLAAAMHIGVRTVGGTRGGARLGPGRRRGR